MKMTAAELRLILDNHRKWLNGEDGGSRADFTRADFTRAVLTRAVLTGAVLTGARLTDADLTGAVLTGARLTDADLTGAVLTRAVLTRADLTGAVLTGARLTGADLPCSVVVEDLDLKVALAVDGGSNLNMGDWHTCETTHCRAGWAIALAGEGGRVMESLIGPAAAGALIYAASRPARPVPNFYAENAEALRSIEEDAIDALDAAAERTAK